jgi:hypothetical protein
MAAALSKSGSGRLDARLPISRENVTWASQKPSRQFGLERSAIDVISVTPVQVRSARLASPISVAADATFCTLSILTIDLSGCGDR